MVLFELHGGIAAQLHPDISGSPAVLLAIPPYERTKHTNCRLRRTDAPSGTGTRNLRKVNKARNVSGQKRQREKWQVAY